MKRGPKKQTPIEKAKRNTLRKDRDGGSAVVMHSAGDAPAMPEYLQPEAKDVWLEEIGRVMVSGVSEMDSSIFATYCSLEACVRKAFKENTAPPAAYLTELRRMRELLGIAGPRTRLGAKQGGAQTDNPFAKNGRKMG